MEKRLTKATLKSFIRKNIDNCIKFQRLTKMDYYTDFYEPVGEDEEITILNPAEFDPTKKDLGFWEVEMNTMPGFSMREIENGFELWYSFGSRCKFWI